jgi:uncharacterized protein YlxW (UPF0749 family)
MLYLTLCFLIVCQHKLCDFISCLLLQADIFKTEWVATTNELRHIEERKGVVLRDFLASIEKKQNDIIGNVAQLQTTVAQMQTTVAQLEPTLRNIIREEIQDAIKNDIKKQIIDLLKFGADNW